MSYENKFNATTQLKLSPFFERTSQLNESQEWRRWAGHLAATSYELTHENEYFAIRTKAALLDITPLKKYIVELMRQNEEFKRSGQHFIKDKANNEQKINSK